MTNTHFKKTPSYCRHRASGQAVVVLGGRMIYLGPYKSKASYVEYDRMIAEWLANGRQLPQDRGGAGPADLTVVELIDRYMTHAREYYVRDGKPTTELGWIRMAMSPLKKLYGSTSAAKFGPLALAALRLGLIDRAHRRGHRERHGHPKASHGYKIAATDLINFNGRLRAGRPCFARGKNIASQDFPDAALMPIVR